MLQRSFRNTTHTREKAVRTAYWGRECEHRGRRERDPLESFCDLGASQSGNAPCFWEVNRSRRASSGGILETETPPEHRRSCRLSSTWMTPRERKGLWHKAETLTRTIDTPTESSESYSAMIEVIEP
ncbi:hypothetical protein V8G54_030132 [Vigna mungo]|uniref:Uncharacterized protein n=1 Tax=Vigna mungo TaxID=3915 RepID=A0AAQ3MVN4_VIGMU